MTIMTIILPLCSLIVSCVNIFTLTYPTLVLSFPLDTTEMVLDLIRMIKVKNSSWGFVLKPIRENLLRPYFLFPYSLFSVRPPFGSYIFFNLRQISFSPMTLKILISITVETFSFISFLLVVGRRNVL